MVAGRYMTELRADVATVLAGRAQVLLSVLDRELGPAWLHRRPSRVTLAKALTGLGWTKLQRPGSGAVFAAPAGWAVAHPAELELPPVSLTTPQYNQLMLVTYANRNGFPASALNVSLRALQRRGLVASRPDPSDDALAIWTVTQAGTAWVTRDLRE